MGPFSNRATRPGSPHGGEVTKFDNAAVIQVSIRGFIDEVKRSECSMVSMFAARVEDEVVRRVFNKSHVFQSFRPTNILSQQAQTTHWLIRSLRNARRAHVKRIV
jgi:hypothetical protein